jgi:hypothetical protein
MKFFYTLKCPEANSELILFHSHDARNKKKKKGKAIPLQAWTDP